MTHGRKVCNTLKEIRRQIADRNDIAYLTTDCHFEGECQGTCPKCEAELKYLENELHKRRLAGKVATVAGIALGIAGTFSTCNIAKQNTPQQDNMLNSEEMRIRKGQIESSNIINTIPTISINSTLIDTTQKDSNYRETLMGIAEIFPEFPGGEVELEKFLKDNIVYPKEAKEAAIEGRVMVRFTINKDGTISDVTVARSPHKLLSDEAVRVIQAMPKWIPGKQFINNEWEPANVRFVLPIDFKLNDKE